VEVDGRKITTLYHASTALAIVAVLMSIVLAIVASQPIRQDFSVPSDNRLEARILLVLLVVFAAETLASGKLFAISKSEVLEATTRFQFVFYNLSIIAVVFSVLIGWQRHTVLLGAGVLGLLLTMYIGHRSSVAVTILSIAYVLYRNRSLLTIKLRYILAGLLALFFLAIYKSVYVAIKAGNYDLVFRRLQFENLADSAMVGLEQFVTFAHLDFIVAYDFRLACSNLWLVPLSVVPFLDSLVGPTECGYNEQVQPVFFPGYRGGVAANIWAEFFANFGYLGFPMLVLVIWFITALIEKAIRSTRSPILKSSLIGSIMHFTFLFQRKELLGGAISAKRAIIVGLLVFLLAWLFRGALRRRVRR